MLPRPARGKARYKSDAMKGEEYLRSRGYGGMRQILNDSYERNRRARAEPEEETPSPLDALPDDVLLNMLDKAASGEYDDACDAVTKWCGLDKRRNGLCRAAGERQWGEMTARIFGANAPTLVADDPMNNFFALCKREERNRAIEMVKRTELYNDFRDEEQQEAFLNAMVEFVILKDRGGMETADGRVRLARMVENAMEQFGAPGDWHNLYYYNDFFSDDKAGKMLEGTEAEVDAGLDLLLRYARAVGDELDFRVGYHHDEIPVLVRLFKDGDAERKEKILDLWRALIYDHETFEEPYEKVRQYIYALMDAEVDDLIVDHLQTHPTYARDCGALLASMAKLIRKLAEWADDEKHELSNENDEMKDKLRALGQDV